MKLLILFLGVLFYGKNLQAQETINNLPRLQERVQAFKSRNGDTTFRKILQNTLIVPGNEVVALPQDNMPCIIPDTKGLAAMPNALLITKPAQPVPGQIPNAWKKREPTEKPLVK